MKTLPAATILRVLDMAGVAVGAVSGALAAGRKNLDLLGVFVISVVTAIGGGTMRDVLLGRQPIFWIGAPTYLWVILAATAFTVLYTRFRRPPLGALLLADAFALGLFAVSGAEIAESFTDSGIVVVLMGTLTGAAGGAVRDVLCNEIPLILQSGPFYATAAIAGATTYHLLETRGAPHALAVTFGMAAVIGLRLASLSFGLRLPVYRLPDDE